MQTNNKIHKKYHVIWFLAFLFLFTSCSRQITRIACAGDSITEGHGLACPAKTSYPSVLDSILGPDYSVLNFGRSATTLQKKGNFPYWICKEFYDVLEYNPDIIIIKLGTNDTKPENWNAERFAKDYQALIDTFKTITANPKIFLCLPVPAFKTAWEINDSTLTAGVLPAIEKIAKNNNLPTIDLYHAMANQSADFPDGIHPNEVGARKIAEFIAKAIKK